MKIEGMQVWPRTLGFVSVLGGLLGLGFYWWVPMGILLGFSGLIAGLVGWAMSPRRARASGLVRWGVILSLVALGVDTFIAMRGLEILQIEAFR